MNENIAKKRIFLLKKKAQEISISKKSLFKLFYSYSTFMFSKEVKYKSLNASNFSISTLNEYFGASRSLHSFIKQQKFWFKIGFKNYERTTIIMQCLKNRNFLLFKKLLFYNYASKNELVRLYNYAEASNLQSFIKVLEPLLEFTKKVSQNVSDIINIALGQTQINNQKGFLKINSFNYKEKGEKVNLNITADNTTTPKVDKIQFPVSKNKEIFNKELFDLCKLEGITQEQQSHWTKEQTKKYVLGKLNIFKTGRL